MTAFVAVACGILGLAVGSFLNVVIHRVPLHLSVVTPRSRCPDCEAPILERDNVPVASWLLLRGKCRSCGARISARYPAVELLTGALFAAAALRFHGSLAIVPYCIGFAGLVALSFIDFDTKLLPKRVVWPVTGMVLAGFVVTAVVEHRADDLQRALLGAAVSSLALGVIWFVAPRSMGFGDVRLEVLLGMLLGWVDRGTVLAGFLLAFLSAGVLGILLIATGIRSRKDHIPFGPWLCIGCVAALLWHASGRWLEHNEIQTLVDNVRSIF
jgi:leader peptidase (prepilin peptidase)/N-methyltransferase